MDTDGTVSPWAEFDARRRRSARKYRSLRDSLGAAFRAVQQDSFGSWDQFQSHQPVREKQVGNVDLAPLGAPVSEDRRRWAHRIARYSGDVLYIGTRFAGWQSLRPTQVSRHSVVLGSKMGDRPQSRAARVHTDIAEREIVLMDALGVAEDELRRRIPWIAPIVRLMRITHDDRTYVYYAHAERTGKGSDPEPDIEYVLRIIVTGISGQNARAELAYEFPTARLEGDFAAEDWASITIELRPRG